MAPQDRITIAARRLYPVILRFANPEFTQAQALLFRRYPRNEWATFARFGWRETPYGLVLTLAGIDEPVPGDLDERVGHIAIQERYSLRVALAAETHPLAVCIIHSHPLNCAPRASDIDDDMDSYYAKYFEGFTGGRPYVSLIFSRVSTELAISGRVFWKGQWVVVDRVVVERNPVSAWVGGTPPQRRGISRPRTQRLATAFGAEAEERLRNATVAIIGAGGTGSAAIEILARAGVGRLILVDPDHVEASNLERLHGGYPQDADNKTPKVVVARDHVKAIDPSIEVLSFIGALPQKEIVDAVVGADVALGCTDKQHSRLALSDIAFRYLVPAIDCGVTLEGVAGHVTGQCLQLIRFLAADPCALCRDIIVPERVARELMSKEEQSVRRAAAKQAAIRGEDPGAYWRDDPQLNTVGYLTTVAGALAAGYAIGWITGRFDPPFSRLQGNLVAEYFDVTDFHANARVHCPCRRARGWADQGMIDALITAPTHWSPVRSV